MRTSTLLQVPAALIAAVLAVASLAPVAQAQDSGFAAQVNVPFAFQTSTGQKFAPGTYTIRMSGDAMLIQGKDSSGLAMTQSANDRVLTTQGKAVFTHYGNQYFLHTVSVAGSASHLICMTSNVEKRWQIAAAGKPSSPVEVALLREGQ
jgi:hypothetical protein